MGLLGGDSRSSTTNQAANDRGRILSGRAARYTESGSFQLGDRSSYQESGALSVGAGGVLKTSADFSGGQFNGASVTIGETGVAGKLADALAAVTRPAVGSVVDLPGGSSPEAGGGATGKTDKALPVVLWLVLGAIVVWLFKR